jgi:hypothetical protein
MFDLIPQIILFLTLGIIVGLIAKNISKVKKFPQHEEIPGPLLAPSENKFFKKIPLEQLNTKFNQLLEKLLRKMRITTMRTDAYLQRRLESLKDYSKPRTIFKVEEKIAETLEPSELISGEEVSEENMEGIEEKSKSIDKTLPVTEEWAVSETVIVEEVEPPKHQKRKADNHQEKNN